MLGLPVIGWLRFFAGGFVAGALLLLVPIKPIPAIGVFEMTVATGGLLVVVAYARCYAPWSLRRLRARARRGTRAIGRAAPSFRRRWHPGEAGAAS